MHYYPVRSLPVILFILAATNVIWGQTRSAILEQYIQEALNRNLGIQQQTLTYDQANEKIKQAKGLYWPKLTFEANYTVAGGGRKIDFPIGDLLNGAYQNLNTLNATPGNLPSGVQIPLFPTLENQSIQFLPHNFQETKVNFAVPLFNSDLRYNRQIQTHLQQSKQAELAASQHNLRYQITEAYLNYLRSLEAEKIWANTKTVLKELRRFNESLVKNNVATRDIVATADYELSRADNEIYQWKSRQSNAKAWFNSLINKPLNDEVIADTLLLRSVITAYNPEQLMQESAGKRFEISALKAGEQAATTDARRNAAQSNLPDFYLGGSTGFQGYGYHFADDQVFALAQIGMTYDVFDHGIRKSKTQEARLEAEKIRVRREEVEQQIQLQVAVAWNDFQAAQNSFESAKSGLAAAEETFRIVHNKYRAGQALLLEYMDAQNRVTTARLQQILAWSEVLLKEAAMRNAAGL
ncbi:MAG: TolC family protein [Saprospiraceae bacterium]|nr:TolC family protein [Saprospiraceae bacterium]